MSEEFFETIAYHTTEKDRAASILEDKFFKESTKDNEWLGHGVYFWDSLEDAVWWKNNVKNADKDDTVIIKVKLRCKYSEYRDLSIKKNMQEYEKECMEVIINNKVKLIKTSYDKLRNFYCIYVNSNMAYNYNIEVGDTLELEINLMNLDLRNTQFSIALVRIFKVRFLKLEE